MQISIIQGSITIYFELMKAANIREYEKVSVVNVHNGERLKPMLSLVRTPIMPSVLTERLHDWPASVDQVIIMSYRTVC